MKFGGLSENDVNKISEILGQEGITFSIDKDQELEDFNKSSMSNNLRHYSPPNITTHILAIEIADEDFQRMSESAKKELLDFGITDEFPSPEDFVPFTGETIHKELKKNQNRVVATNVLHQLLIAAGLIIVGLVIKMILKSM